ncbi:MAG: response regulator transcription factor [Balneolales bacterium]|nr:response regulator transcription factor [Balneolales bacterium]
MSKETILIVDDERDLLDLIEYNLEKEGYDVLKAENGQEGIRLAKKHHPDLIILDVMMPKMNGIEVIRELKYDRELKFKPVIFLTARSDEKTELEGLELGADDYLAKPISTAKLLSRIKTVLRRVAAADEPDIVLNAADLVIDRSRYVVSRGSEEFQLPRKEFEVLSYLAARPGKVLDRQTLLNEVWGNNIYVIDRTVDVHIRKIREKLGDHYIETIKGVGYRFKE